MGSPTTFAMYLRFPDVCGTNEATRGEVIRCSARRIGEVKRATLDSILCVLTVRFDMLSKTSSISNHRRVPGGVRGFVFRCHRRTQRNAYKLSPDFHAKYNARQYIANHVRFEHEQEIVIAHVVHIL